MRNKEPCIIPGNTLKTSLLQAFNSIPDATSGPTQAGSIENILWAQKEELTQHILTGAN